MGVFLISYSDISDKLEAIWWNWNNILHSFKLPYCSAVECLMLIFQKVWISYLTATL